MTARPARGNVLRDYGATILVAVAVALVVRFFFFEAYRIPTSAMRPTLESGDTIFVAKYPFGLFIPGIGARLTQGRTPRRGEVVLYSPPGETGRSYIKRVIGLPGDSVQMAKGRLILNGTPVALELPQGTSCGRETLPGDGAHGACLEPPLPDDFGPEKVPENAVFLLGDLRTRTLSIDGNKRKGWGTVPIFSLRGKAQWIWLSIQPQTFGNTGWFPQFRFERMFRRIE